MTAVEPPKTPSIPTPPMAYAIRFAMYVLFASGLASFIFAAALRRPDLATAGAIELVVGLMCYAAAAFITEQHIIRGASGKQYPRFKILGYLTPADMLRVRLQDWEIVRGGTGVETVIRTYEHGWRSTCPLAVALGTFQGCPGPGAITDVIYNAKYGAITDPEIPLGTNTLQWCEIHDAVEEFLKWADEGHINPTDINDIFDPQYAGMSLSEKQYAYERRHDE
jgi:hypothetical protein